jgi:hypothetical protein
MFNINETNDLPDILGEGIRYSNKAPKFGRFPSLDEDLLELKKKWLNTKNEVLVQHMIDSLIIFNHNRKNFSQFPTIQKNVKELTLTN